jgi:hypothetical protein
MTGPGLSIFAIPDPMLEDYLMRRRQSILMELVALEDYLIKNGRLQRRSVVTQKERKGRCIDTTTSKT